MEFAKYGFTDQCPGRETAQAGTKNRAHNEDCRKRIEGKMTDDNVHKKRLIETKKRKEKYYEESDKKKRKDAEAPEESDEARGAEAKRDREEQKEDQPTSEASEPSAKRIKDDEEQEQDLDMEIDDEATKDINQMDFWEVYNAEADDNLAYGEDQPEDTTFWDDNSGKQLNPKMVRQAREEEMAQFRDHQVYEKVPTQEAAKSGSKLITTRWVDINKGDDENPKYRSRLVARELNTHDQTGLFAATPPLEAKKVLFSMAMTQRGDQKEDKKLAFFDVSRAYFYAPATRNVYIKLPDEDAEPGMCGKLKKSMYGTRDAAKSWEVEYQNTMAELGFKAGKATTCAFHHEERDILAVIHGDDITVLANQGGVSWMKDQLMTRYNIKLSATLGPEQHDDKSVRILNRIVTWTENSLEYEADQRHAELILQELDLCSARPMSSPGTIDRQPEDDDDEELTGRDATKYRRLVARLNYIAQDRPDIQYATKELRRHMSDPRKGDVKAMKRIARYLAGKERLVLKYAKQWTASETLRITSYADADFAGCRATRKSTSGGVLMNGKHCLKTWSTTQNKVSLSSGEAEYYALVKCGCETLGLQSVMADLGIQTMCVMVTQRA